MRKFPEWKRVEKKQTAHLQAMADAGGKLVPIKVANRATQREQKVIICGGYCQTCGMHLNDILWRSWSPLNRTQEEMPLIADRQEAAAPS